MNKLRVASFGIRGFVGESLPPVAVIDFAAAFATYLDGGRIVLGRDTRGSSPMLHAAVTAGLLSAGCEVLDLGICPTPLLQYSTQPYAAAGALSISGGHNGAGWNSLTLIAADGAFLDPVSGEAVLDHFHARTFRKCGARDIGTVVPMRDYAPAYFAALAEQVNVAAIEQAGFTVLIDPVGGAGSPFLEAFARTVGVQLVPINARPSTYLAREPEPRPRSALPMASFIRYVKGDVGFVCSSDMGRMSVVTESGEPASEEYTLPLIADHLLPKRSGPLVTNICTTRTVDDVAARHRAPLIKTRVGQAYVMDACTDVQGVLGGEGSGSVAVPTFSQGFDGFLMMALLLEAMAESGATVSALLEQLPRYAIVKRQVDSASREAYRALDAVRDAADFIRDGTVDHVDGIRVDWEDGWVHVRTSRTQQLVRVIAEAKDEAVAHARAAGAVQLIQQAL